MSYGVDERILRCSGKIPASESEPAHTKTGQVTVELDSRNYKVPGFFFFYLPDNELRIENLLLHFR